ncbi:MAG: hypothetical protein KJ697_01835 [Nanoarchaeota archaeon]|nr:hypothetical protein [Nanoarchaeota archaeon]MBU4123847.1 hypothetical protein [Nanoarchaeota archaeon]
MNKNLSQVYASLTEFGKEVIEKIQLSPHQYANAEEWIEDRRDFIIDETANASEGDGREYRCVVSRDRCSALRELAEQCEVNFGVATTVVLYSTSSKSVYPPFKNKKLKCPAEDIYKTLAKSIGPQTTKKIIGIGYVDVEYFHECIDELNKKQRKGDL